MAFRFGHMDEVCSYALGLYLFPSECISVGRAAAWLASGAILDAELDGPSMAYFSRILLILLAITRNGNSMY